MRRRYDCTWSLEKRASRRPEVAAVTRQNSHLSIELRQSVETAPLIRLLVSAGAEIEEVRRGKANLEEVFLTLMEEEK